MHSRLKDPFKPEPPRNFEEFGDFQQFNPHLHLIATDGCFAGNGTFTKSFEPEPKDLEDLFPYEVLKMLKA
ncbi:MAG: hypothetical protein PVH87_11860 [Desulfobacteraceae bacterium]